VCPSAHFGILLRISVRVVQLRLAQTFLSRSARRKPHQIARASSVTNQLIVGIGGLFDVPPKIIFAGVSTLASTILLLGVECRDRWPRNPLHSLKS